MKDGWQQAVQTNTREWMRDVGLVLRIRSFQLIVLQVGRARHLSCSAIQ